MRDYLNSSNNYIEYTPIYKSNISVKAEYRRLIIYKFVKRSFDLFSSMCAFIVLSWLFAIVAIVIKMTSKGSALFLDHRIGLDGKDIYVYKFRTMYIDAEEHIRNYLSEEQYHEWLTERKVDNDPRITPIGLFLRKTSIDELPQLLNIIKGDLSIVGPRPLTRHEIEDNFTPGQQEKLLSCKPGLTGNWAAYGRSNVTYESGERQRMELEYVYKRSLLFDIKIIFITVIAVLRRQGAM